MNIFIIVLLFYIIVYSYESLSKCRGEVLIPPVEKYFKHLTVTPLSSFCTTTFFSSPFVLKNILHKQVFDIMNIQSRPDIFFFFKKKGVKYIFESHAIHPWISLKYSLLITESFRKRFLIILGYPLFKFCYWYNIRRVDCYHVSLPGIAAFLNEKYLYEVLFESLENMFPLACKLIDDKEFRAQYIKRNYEYVMKVHSPESVAQQYEKDILQLFSNRK